MKQLKKTVLILLLATVMTLGMVPLAAMPVHANDPGGATETNEADNENNADPSGDAVVPDGENGVTEPAGATDPAGTPETKTLNNANAGITAVEYKLCVGGKQVTSSNAGNIFGDGTASYDNSTNTLTLKNARISGTDGDACIYSEGMDLKIVLEGDNTVGSNNATQGILTRYGSGSGANKGSLMIEGSGTLTVSVSGPGSVAVAAEKDVTIKSGTVNASASGTECYAVDASGGVYIEGGTVNASANGEESTAIYGARVNISGGTVTADATGEEADAIFASQSITIGKNARLTASGEAAALRGSVKNEVSGIGWTDYAGKEGKADIAVNTGGQRLSYRKVKFPAKNNITVKQYNDLQIQVDKQAASAGETVAVKVWVTGAYSPVIYVKRTSDGTIVQEVELAASGQGFAGTFTMPDYDVTVTGKLQGAGDGGDEDKDSTKDSGSGKSASSKSPNTGDEQNAAGWITMMITSALALAALAKKRKVERQR